MIDVRTPSGWLRLVALCPLAAIGPGFVDALLLGGVITSALLAVDIGLRGLRHWLTTDQQPIIAAMLAAIATGICALLLQAFCHTHAQSLLPLLPLPIVVAVLFCRPEDIPSKWMGMPGAILRGTAFAMALLIGAALHAALPDDAGIAISLILSGLLLALTHRSEPQAAASEASTSTPRTRARVTGSLR
jgi:Na+-translocating ferredoxin:NAD+ oxidoreductase RnfE subunit